MTSSALVVAGVCCPITLSALAAGTTSGLSSAASTVAASTMPPTGRAWLSVPVVGPVSEPFGCAQDKPFVSRVQAFTTKCFKNERAHKLHLDARFIITGYPSSHKLSQKPMVPSMWGDQIKMPFFHKAFPEIIRSAVATLVAMGMLCTLHARRSV